MKNRFSYLESHRRIHKALINVGPENESRAFSSGRWNINNHSQ
jgi:hypothetical protein